MTTPRLDAHGGSAAPAGDDAPPRRWGGLRPSFGWALVFAVLAANAIDWAISKRVPGVDFEVFHRAGARILRGEPLYRLSDGHFAYKYAPAFAFVFAPLSALPLRLGWGLFGVVSAALLVQVMRWSARRTGVGPGALDHVLVLVLLHPLAVHLFRLGQVEALLLALVLASEATHDRPVLSGGLWAAACVAKPPFLVLALPSIARRQWRRLAALGVGIVVWIGLGVALRGGSAGLADLAAWRDLLRRTTPPLLCYAENQSVWSFACPRAVASADVRPPTGAALGLAIALTVAIVAPVALVARRDRERAHALGVASALYLAAALSPLGWRTNLLAAIPLLYLAVGLALRARTRSSRLLSGAAAVGVFSMEYAAPLALSWAGEHAERCMTSARAYGLAYAVLAVGALWAAAVERPSRPVRGTVATGGAPD